VSFAKYIRVSLDVLGIVLAVAACLTVLYYWDTTRIYYKRFRADGPYRYDAIDPRLRARDPTEFIHVRDAAAAEAIRETLRRVIWGEAGLPDRALPDLVVSDLLGKKSLEADCADISDPETRRKLRCELGLYRPWKNLAGLDELRVSVGPEYKATVAYFRPVRANATLVLYHHGYAGTFHDQHRLLEYLVDAGYTVAAFNLLGYGDNSCPGVSAWCNVAWGKFGVPLPMRLHFKPPVATINYAGKHGLHRVAMIGLSTGAWVTTVLSAVEPRIARSYAVAGAIPFYMRRGSEWPSGHRYPPLMKAATMLDLFVLGATPAGRSQWQIYNRYDRCCYDGVRSALFGQVTADAVQKIGGGRFDVVIDETHPRHKISRWAFERILRDLDAMQAGRP